MDAGARRRRAALATASTTRNAPGQVATGVRRDWRPDIALARGEGGRHGVGLGRQSGGKLGVGAVPRRTRRHAVAGLTNVVAVAAGRHHSLALKADGTVWAFGAQRIRAVGRRRRDRARTTPVQVPGLSGVTAIAAGDDFSLALGSDGAGGGVVWAWGKNYGGPARRRHADRQAAAGARPEPVERHGDCRRDRPSRPPCSRTARSGAGATTPTVSWARATRSIRRCRSGPQILIADGRTIAGGPSTAPSSSAPTACVWAWGRVEAGESGDVSAHMSGEAWVPAACPGFDDADWRAISGDQWALGRTGGRHALGHRRQHAAVSSERGTRRPSRPRRGCRRQDSRWSDNTLARRRSGRRRPVDVARVSARSRSAESRHQRQRHPRRRRDGGHERARIPTATATASRTSREVQRGTDPFNADTDGDGANDRRDAFPLDPTRSTAPPPVPGDTTPPTITLTEPTNAIPVP